MIIFSFDEVIAKEFAQLLTLLNHQYIVESLPVNQNRIPSAPVQEKLKFKSNHIYYTASVTPKSLFLSASDPTKIPTFLLTFNPITALSSWVIHNPDFFSFHPCAKQDRLKLNHFLLTEAKHNKLNELLNRYTAFSFPVWSQFHANISLDEAFSGFEGIADRVISHLKLTPTWEQRKMFIDAGEMFVVNNFIYGDSAYFSKHGVEVIKFYQEKLK
jgi:hypothetical protein